MSFRVQHFYISISLSHSATKPFRFVYVILLFRGVLMRMLIFLVHSIFSQMLSNQKHLPRFSLAGKEKMLCVLFYMKALSMMMLLKNSSNLEWFLVLFGIFGHQNSPQKLDKFWKTLTKKTIKNLREMTRFTIRKAIINVMPPNHFESNAVTYL